MVTQHFPEPIMINNSYFFPNWYIVGNVIANIDQLRYLTIIIIILDCLEAFNA